MAAHSRNGRFRVFTRTWWTKDPTWPNGLRPEAGRATTIGYADTEREARIMCNGWNADHEPGPYSRRAEYTDDVGGAA